jgi:hypothetical protein
MSRGVRWIQFAALVVLVAGPMASPSQATAAGAVDTVDPSGISLVGSDAIQFKAQNETQAKAFDAALNLA